MDCKGRNRKLWYHLIPTHTTAPSTTHIPHYTHIHTLTHPQARHYPAYCSLHHPHPSPHTHSHTHTPARTSLPAYCTLLHPHPPSHTHTYIHTPTNRSLLSHFLASGLLHQPHPSPHTHIHILTHPQAVTIQLTLPSRTHTHHYTHIPLTHAHSQGVVSKSVEHGPRMREIVGSNPWSSQTNDPYH